MRRHAVLVVKLAVPLLLAVPAALIAGSTPSSIALGSSPNPSVFGHTVTLVASVAPPTATGNVTFYDGTTVLGTTKLLGAALITSLLPSGPRRLKAYYGGDTNYAPSASAALVQSVNAVPGGGFQTAVSYSAGNQPFSVVLGDFNGDGNADFAVANYNGNVSVLLGHGDGTFQAAVNYSVGGSIFSVAVGDFNRDGKVDLVGANDGYVSVLLGNGDGTFQAAVNYGAGYSPESVAVGDFNGDGIADLAVANFNGNNVSVLVGNGDGTFQAAVNYGVGNGPLSVAVGDFNGDGRADLVVANDGSNNVSVLVGNGDGTLQAAVNYGVGNSPHSVAVGDFNGDGRADLVVANRAPGVSVFNVSVLLGKGDGTFQAAVNYRADNNVYCCGFTSLPYSVAVGDFNGDGKPDVSIANYGVNNVGVLLGNGDGTFQGPVTYGLGNPQPGVFNYPESIAVGDFNGDGKTDLVTANSQGKDVSVLLGLAPAPDLSIAITHAGNFAQGQTGAAYAITVSNAGYAPTFGTVTVTDSLPLGLAATNISGTGWTCVLATASCTRGDPLVASASYPVITVAVGIAANAPGGVTNTGSVSGGGQTNATSDFTTTFTSAQVAQAWSSLKPPASANSLNAALLMTDGTVMLHQDCSGNWYRLAPDSFGNYLNGTWSQASSMPSEYGPLYFSSAVLADGRLVVIGGEFNNPCTSPVLTSLGAIYDPTANAWTSLSAPSGWTEVGDSSNVVLPDGRFLLASQSTQLARLDPATLTWTNLMGTGKAETNSEEGWTLLADGTVFTVDVANGTQTERYFPQTDTWAAAGNTVAPLASMVAEMGPQVLRPNGTVFVAGATGHTGVYNVATSTWAAGPDFPVSNGEQLAISDGPGSLLPSGNVLVGAFSGQSVESAGPFFEFDGTHLNPVPAPPGGLCFALLLLPSGQVLCTSGGVDIYTPSGSPDPAWAPTIAAAPSVVQPGLTYGITGTQFNGLSQAVAFGDDYQGATNYPLVRITNTATGHVVYCRTHNHSTMGVATGATPVSTQFDVPPAIETGPSTLVVVANGIASKPWSLTVTAALSGAVPTIKGVEGGGLSVPAVTAISANGYFAIFGANFAPAGTSRQLAPSDIVNGTLPTSLASTCVYVGPASALLTYISPGQINAIAPSLPATGSTSVTVVTNCGAANAVTSPAVNVPVAAASPEFLYWVQNANGQDAVIALDAEHGDYIGPPGLIPGLTFRAARAGDILTIYGIGFGGTRSGPVPGLIPSAPDSVPAGYSVTIGGTAAAASYVGVTPTEAGLYQVNVTIPAGIAPGNYPIVLNVNGVSTPAGAFLAIGP